MSTSSSVMKYWAYISGIQIPVGYVQITNVQGDMASGFIQTPFSPFLIHLPKATKLTIFEYDSSVDEFPILAFDGTITQITESISSSGTALNLGFSSDGHIWKLRSRVMVNIETFFSRAQTNTATVLAQNNGGTVQNGFNNSITDWMTDIFKAAKDDAAKAAMVFLTGIFKPRKDKNDQSSGYYYVDGNKQVVMKRKAGYGEAGDGNDKQMPGTFYEETHNDEWYPFIRRYYEWYNLPYKAGYISQTSKPYFAEMYLKNLLNKGLDSVKFGNENYWALACRTASYLDAEVVSVPDATFNNGYLIEFIAKPISPLGALPLCNVVYPNQIQQYTHTKNYFKEPTRVMAMGAGSAFLQQDNFGIFTTFNCGPTLKDGYLDAFNIVQGSKNVEMGFSEYEKEYGINPRNLSGNHLEVALNSETQADKKEGKFAGILNHEFVKNYFGSKEFSMTVTPNNRYVIGMTIAILRRDLHHTLAYLFGTTKMWDASGQSALQLHMAYSRQFDFTIDENIHEFVDGFEHLENRKQYATHIGMKTEAIVPAGPETITAVKSAYKEWNTTYDKNSEVMKAANPGKYRRNHCSFPEFCKFIDKKAILPTEYFDSFELTMPKVMPVEIVNILDTTEMGAELSTAQYYYYDPFTEESINAVALAPHYEEIGVDGPIVPSTYISGIVNCHLRYLKEVAHTISY